MKARHAPRVWAKHKITTTKLREEIGFIQLVSYLRGDSKPHLEYFIKEEYRSQGIMGKELPKYLKKQKQYNPQLIAVVKQDNYPSIKLLETNGFIKVKDINDNACYIIDLNFTPDVVEKMVLIMKKNFPREQEIKIK